MGTGTSDLPKDRERMMMVFSMKLMYMYMR